jgi:hypothetical protein
VTLLGRNDGEADDRKRLRKVLSGMTERCHNPKNKAYARYGGRGIIVCEEWRHQSATFIKWAIRNGYRKGLQIDRRDTNGNYEPTNCRWVTPTQQQRNRSNNQMLTAFGERKTLAEWAEDIRCVVSYKLLHKRMVAYRWNGERAITTTAKAYGINERAKLREAFGESKSLTEWSRDSRCAVSFKALYGRVTRFGWCLETALTKVSLQGSH